jgi:hypothetical protein
MSILSFLFGGCRMQPSGKFAITHKDLLVRGWSDIEMKQIIRDFQQLYHDRLSQNFSTEIHIGDEGILRVAFPADIEPRLFCWLVNYVRYPEGFDLKSRNIFIVGRATMSSDFLPSDKSLIGKGIIFYIPTDDNRFDEVFAQVDSQSYRYPFASERWQRVQESRLPVGVSDLKGY